MDIIVGSRHKGETLTGPDDVTVAAYIEKKGCEQPKKPDAKVDITEWEIVTPPKCDETTVTESRTVTTTEYVWSDDKKKWVTDKPVSTTENRTRDLTKDEVKPCDVQPTTPPSPQPPQLTEPPAPQPVQPAKPVAPQPTTQVGSDSGSKKPASVAPATGGSGSNTNTVLAAGLALLALIGAGVFGVMRFVSNRR